MSGRAFLVGAETERGCHRANSQEPMLQLLLKNSHVEQVFLYSSIYQNQGYTGRTIRFSTVFVLVSTMSSPCVTDVILAADNHRPVHLLSFSLDCKFKETHHLIRTSLKVIA